VTLRDRLDDGAPLRLGELAHFLGYSREHLRKLADRGRIKTLRRIPRAGIHRRVTVDEAERVAKEMGLL